MSSAINVISACIVGVAIILHIICMATTYYSSIDVAEVEKAIAKSTQRNQSFGLGDGESPEVPVHGTIHFGPWKYCLAITVPNMGPAPASEPTNFCFRLGTDTELGSTGLPESIEAPGWLKGTQALSIIGLLLEAAGGALLAVHAVRPSKGERLRWFPRFIMAFCVAGGVIILIGDIVFARNHTRFYFNAIGMPVPGQEDSGMDLLEGIRDVVDDHIRLAWGFGVDVFAALLCALTGVMQFAMAWLEGNGGSVVV